MTFDGNESEQISLELASAWTANYRTANQNATKAHFFGKQKLLAILNQTGCTGIRAYYAIDDDGAKQLVFVGADSDGEDLFNGVILERSHPCPSICATDNPLNS